VDDPRVREFVRLFNQEEFFEAHEVLEDLWQDHTGPDRAFYQGLIQVAVALEHCRRGNLPGARGVLESAHRRLDPYRPAHGGFDLESLLEGAARHIEGAGTGPAPRLPQGTDG